MFINGGERVIRRRGLRDLDIVEVGGNVLGTCFLMFLVMVLLLE